MPPGPPEDDHWELEVAVAGGDGASAEEGLAVGDGPDAVVAPAPPHTHRLDFASLQADGRFLRDSALGGMFHPRKVSLREHARKDGLHLSVGEGNRLSVHVDRYSPLAERRGGSARRYSVIRVLAHNLGIVVDCAVLVVRRRWGQQRCELECEVACSDHDVDVTDAHHEGGGLGS